MLLQAIPKKRFAALHSGLLFNSVQVFPASHMPRPNLSAPMQLCHEKCQSSIPKGAHTVKKHLHCTCKLFFLHAFRNRSEAHCPINCAVSFLFLCANAATGVRMVLVRFSLRSVMAQATGVLSDCYRLLKAAGNIQWCSLRITIA